MCYVIAMKKKLYPYITFKSAIGPAVSLAAAIACFALTTIDKAPFVAMGALCAATAAILMIVFAVKTHRKRKTFVRAFSFSDSNNLVVFHAKGVSVSDARIVSLAFDPWFLDDLCAGLSKVAGRAINSSRMPKLFTVYYCPVESINVYGLRCRGKQKGKYAWIEFYNNHFRAYDMFSLARHEIGHALLDSCGYGANHDETMSRMGI